MAPSGLALLENVFMLVKGHNLLLDLAQAILKPMRGLPWIFF